MAALTGRQGPHGEQAAERRFAIRINVNIEADLVDQGRRHCTVALTNLSITGCRFESDLPLRMHAPVTLTIDGVAPIEGEIVWAEGKLMGCHFAEALSPTICNRIIRTLRERQERR
ncbi:hypothetical protein GCM10009424_28620 [Sphingomonas ursincola]|jgi:hypothetical protein|uniref:PilZ domain-containing protein n=1 Tax=Sphingomonas ursincola TaxID=56361 RepID=A0A7V8U7G8_9SPHN|nr:PilZ domain-containing protein [Sphingomonas ursincola]MBA1373402.1 PilZ domain-containing protein [Sphingomonas ursincola]MBA4781080.1 PilZ domain-containing protein [Blastomonas sp.]MCH2237300.1 PilZ domain-containing protein [Blastomonas sp.]OHD01741.1 MAG: hypothetical protein A2885_07230 [Sphingopyxis sp. RIFCSPHIGHO2_01_FULL_65_24]